MCVIDAAREFLNATDVFWISVEVIVYFYDKGAMESLWRSP
jgi:hypothetical protein